MRTNLKKIQDIKDTELFDIIALILESIGLGVLVYAIILLIC